jgi:hypothetical protein
MPTPQAELDWRRSMADMTSVQVMLVPDAGYLPAQEKPESWKKLVDQFLR